MKQLVLFATLLLLSAIAFANIRVAKIFGDNMVLQRNKPIPVWGWADAGEQVTVQFNNQLKTVTAGADGRWMIKLDAEKAGGPFTMAVKGKSNTITYSNVLVGEVWVCSGQSNMEFRVQTAVNAATEIAGANYPEIRHIKVPLNVAVEPKNDIPGGDWKVCNPDNVGDFTAVGYFFAREIYNQLHVPVGLINTTWGGTQVESWTSRDAFEHSDDFKYLLSSMPVLNIDSIAQVKKAAMDKTLIALQGSLPKEGETASWKELSFDAGSWPKMQLPSAWEQKGLPDLDGFVWFRKEVIVSDADAGKPAVLELSMIDDNDNTYVNGVPVGTTIGYNIKRKYAIPAGVLKAGKNIVAVRVEDTGGGGGIYGEAGDMKITTGSDVQPLAGEWSFKVEKVVMSAGVGPNSYPTLLYNAMVSPLIPYAIEGALWYQGEANAGRAYQYRAAFPLMITDWRKHWGQGDFPFYFVQLASFNAGNGNSNSGSTWAELREAQTLTLSLKNTGMAVITDIGEEKDIHPKNKQDVGKRLAAIALNNVYDKKMVCSGPTYKSMKADGNKIILSFSNIGSGLLAKGGELQGFEISGNDHVFYKATAVINGDRITVSSDKVATPVAVHFAWSDYPGDANFYNKEGFPAVPFRTDSWKEETQDVKYEVGE